MDDRDLQALQAYREHRHDDQVAFYAGRTSEYEQAHAQALLANVLLMIGASAAGLLASIDVWGARPVWGIAGVALAAGAAFVSAYTALIGYEQVGDLYRNTGKALGAIAPPDGAGGTAAYVEEVEGVLRQEQGDWGELITRGSDERGRA